MVQRIARRGPHKGQSFWGCSSYPKCSGIKNLEENQSEEVVVDIQPQKKTEKTTPLTDKQKAELCRLRDRLLNLSSRNRSIKLSKLYKMWSFDLSRLNEFDKDLPNKIITACLNSEKDTYLLPKLTEDNEKIWQKCFGDLTAISKQVNAIYREKGLYDLYVGYPFLSGVIDASQTVIQAPIFLIPIKLNKIIPKKGQNNWSISIDKDEPIIFNKTLFFALGKLGKYNFNSNLFDEKAPLELYGETSFIDWAYNLLNEYGIVCRKSDIADDQIIDPLIEFSSKELPESFFNGLTIHQNAVLGHFPQSSSSVQKDYEKLLEMSQEELVSILPFLDENISEDHGNDQATPTSKSTQDNSSEETQAKIIEDGKTIDDRPESDNYFVLSSDSSQDRIVMEVADSELPKLVIWGPPGTGKSQTIVNIISNCLKKGKTVLLVSQKRAALDVVQDRLALKKMGDFTAVVHDAFHDKKTLYANINNLLDGAVPAQRPIDKTDEIGRATKNLQEIIRALNDKTFGISLRDIYQRLGSKVTINRFKPREKWLNKKYDEIIKYSSIFDELQRSYINTESYKMLSARRTFSNLDASALAEIESVLEVLDNPNVIAAYEIKKFLNNKTDVEALRIKLPKAELGVEFIEIAERLKSFATPTKLFKPSFWRLYSKFSELKKKVQNLCHNLEAQCIPSFEKILDQKSAKHFSNQLRSTNLSNLDLLQAFNLLKDSFHTIRSFDLLAEQHKEEIGDEIKAIAALDATADSSWGKIFEHSILSLWLQKLEDRHPCLSLVMTGKADDIRVKYAELLDEKSEYAAFKLLESVKRTAVDPTAKKLAQSLKADVNRQRNIKTIRKFNESYFADKSFRKLVPVWLSSPEAVSDIFPLVNGLFDVVIFDEASQCTVESGIPAVYRGKQVIIAGDEKQLPPSHFFEVQYENQDEEESFASNEPSLLTLAKKIPEFRYKMLEWHYRSKFEELISFSNHVFYEGKIKIAPNVSLLSQKRESAITWHTIGGYWENRSNIREAEKVLERLKYYLTNEPERSIGIVTFNITQKQLIETLIDETEINDPEFRDLLARNNSLPIDRQYFVKNIENVQGDERDVIIFSVGYAPTAPGERVYQMFGSLSQKGGENRLNVAISRAISKIEIVCSVDPEKDLSPSGLNAGPKIFKDYLCYAKAIADGNLKRALEVIGEYNLNTKVKDFGINAPESPLENEVFEALQEMGYRVHCQVGQSGFRIDMAIIDPEDNEKYLLGIECDGALYHSSISVRERDVFRQRFLESRGWKIYRVWSTNWWHNKDKEKLKLKSAIEGLKIQKMKAA